MSTDVELVCHRQQASRCLDRAQTWLGGFERRFSRFQPSSEVSRLNGSAGKAFRVSPQLLHLLTLALTLAQRSGGLFDPTVLRSLEAAGYDRSFERIGGRTVMARDDRGTAASWKDVQIDRMSRTVILPADAGIDLGGIAKGWAVDRLSAMIGRPGLVNAGGDLYASGQPADADAWLVGMEDPFDPGHDLAVLAVRDRGVATSTTLRRCWQVGGSPAHHLIDPRTGKPSDSDAIQVTVIAESAVLADYHAKVALLSGVEGGLAYLESIAGIEGLIVSATGCVRTTGLPVCG
jgi:thiamine biosynthesis lipoprotein